MKEPKDRSKRIVLEDIEDDPYMVSSLALSEAEQKMIDSRFNIDDNQVIEEDRESAHYQLMEEPANNSDFKISIGATLVSNMMYLDDDEYEPEETNDIPDSEHDMQSLEDLSEEDLDRVFSAARMEANKGRGVNPEHLSKIWRISHEDAKRTIKTTSQYKIRTQDPKLSRNYGTGDRSLRYTRINTHFFMDTFFASKKKGKSSRGNTCCQLFVTDKGFVYVVPMKSKGDVLHAMKQFVKEIGTPEAFVCDMSGEQMSSNIKQFCNDIATSLRALEEGTPW